MIFFFKDKQITFGDEARTFERVEEVGRVELVIW